MRQQLGWIAIAWLLVLCALALVAYGSPHRSVSLSQRTREVASQLRCPVCAGESVADAPATLAQQMRVVIHRQLAAGKTPDQIKQFFVARYGNHVLEEPGSSGVGLVAWIAPPLLLIGGIGLLAMLLVEWRRRGRTPLRGNSTYLDRVRTELAQESDG